jgi:hypothetical protein
MQALIETGAVALGFILRLVIPLLLLLLFSSLVERPEAAM